MKFDVDTLLDAVTDGVDKEIERRNETRWIYRTVKRAFDIIFSMAVCLVGLIPSLILCIAICFDSSGLPFFRQARVGKDGRLIRVFKFRTMYEDADDHPERYLSSKQLAIWKREQKVNSDPRITRIGRILRKTSIDEFPQFINVLIGDMSVVGPRPVTERETEEFGVHRRLALSVRPGITGLWQVTERNNATWENGVRQRIELAYVYGCSLKLDMKIILATFGTMLGKTGM